MIFNYVLSHYSIEEVNFDDNTYDNLRSLLQAVDRENIILIIDNGGKIISTLKKNINQFNKLKKTDYLFNLLERIADKSKIYRHEYKYDEDNVEDFINSIKKAGITIDAVITDQEEQNRFEKSIPLQEFSEEHANDFERRKIHSEGINLRKLSQSELNQHYTRVVWDSSDFTYIDYHFGKFGLSTEDMKNLKSHYNDNGIKKWRVNNKDVNRDYNDQTRNWWHGFNALKIAIEAISEDISKDNEIVIKIYTPQPFNIYKNNNNEKLVNTYKLNRKIIECINDIMFKKLETLKLSFELYFFDPLEEGDIELGKGPHNRYLFSKSSKSIDVGKGLDNFGTRNRKIQQNRWGFLGEKSDIMEEIISKNPRKIEGFNEIIEELSKS